MKERKKIKWRRKLKNELPVLASTVLND
jgi:hypothetical protein